MKKKIPVIIAAALLAVTFILYCFQGVSLGKEKDVEILRVYNWEEYISESKEDESIDIITQFEKYCKETLNRNVKVEYSTFGTNENMYNELNLSKKKTANGVNYSYDLVCPSEYMLLKMMREGMLEKLDMAKVPNYAENASPYIQELFKTLKNEGSDESLYDYAACYMWGTMGYVYNPEIVSDEDASHWNLLWNDKYKGLGTIKDSVRDSYILAVGYCLEDELNGVLKDYEKDRDSAQYNKRLTEIFNRTDDKTVDTVGKALTDLKDKIYGYEVDSGKKEMAQGKIAINFAWSGDAVYTLDEAETPDAGDNALYLKYAVPKEGSNIFFDGWAMPKGANVELAQEFINFIESPDNAVLNMDYIGYTPSIGGETMFENAIDWYGATAYAPTTKVTKEDVENMDEEEAEYYYVDESGNVYESVYVGDYVNGETLTFVSTPKAPLYELDDENGLTEITDPVEVAPQDLTYFFKSGEDDENTYVVYYYPEEADRQLMAQYPDEKTVLRCTVMKCFTDDETRTLNNMWETAKVGNTSDLALIITLVIIALLVAAIVVVYQLYKKGVIFQAHAPKGYTFTRYEK